LIDEERSKEDLINELNKLRQHNSELESSLNKYFLIKTRDGQAIRAGKLRLETLKKEHSKELEAANLRTDQILDSIQDPFYTLDDEWRFTYANDQVQKQYSRFGNIYGQNIWSLLPDMVGSVFWDKYHEVKHSKKHLS